MADIDTGAAHVHFTNGEAVPFDIVVQRDETDWMAGIRVSDDSGALRHDEKTEYDAFLKGHHNFCMINSENVSWVAGPQVEKIEKGVAYYHYGMTSDGIGGEGDDVGLRQLVGRCVGRLGIDSRMPHVSEAEKKENRRKHRQERERREREKSVFEKIFS